MFGGSVFQKALDHGSLIVLERKTQFNDPTEHVDLFPGSTLLAPRLPAGSVGTQKRSPGLASREFGEQGFLHSYL